MANPVEVYTPLFSEILEKVAKAKTKSQKVQLLQKHNTDSLRMFLKAAFDPKLEWVFPEGEVPYTPNDAPEGTEHNVLAREARTLWHYIKGADPKTRQVQKENMFFQLLESLHESEAKLLVHAKDKKLHQVYKGLSSNVVQEAFGWDENFVVPAPEEYPQGSRSANGND